MWIGYDNIHSSSLAMASSTEFCDEDGYSCITGETLKKAMEELGENPSTRASMVKSLREKILTKESESDGTDGNTVSFERKDGRFLLRFLRARKFNVNRAFQLYVNYYKYRHKFSHLLTDFHPLCVKNVIDAGIFGVLETPMKNTSRALLVYPSHWDYTTVCPNDPYKTFLMILEKLIEDEEVQVHGISIIDNMKSMSFSLAYAFLRAEHIQNGALVELQDSFPLRFKGIHILNQPWYLSMIMTVVKPFIRQKHRSRFLAHGSEYTLLYEYIEASELPSNFGGLGDLLDGSNLRKFFGVNVCECESLSSQTLSLQSGNE